jgi:hypothetical protein
MDEHPHAFAEALGRVEEHLRNRRESRLTLDLWGPLPCVATAVIDGQSFSGHGPTPSAALRNLASRLAALPPARDIHGR